MKCFFISVFFYVFLKKHLIFYFFLSGKEYYFYIFYIIYFILPFLKFSFTFFPTLILHFSLTDISRNQPRRMLILFKMGSNLTEDIFKSGPNSQDKSRIFFTQLQISSPDHSLSLFIPFSHLPDHFNSALSFIQDISVEVI